MEVIKTSLAPAAIGPYSQAIKIDGMVFCSGQIGLKVDGSIVGNEISVQTAQVLKNLTGILEKAGSSIGKVVKTTVYLKSMADFGEMNRVYEDFFKDIKPARSTVEVSNLPRNALIEIDCIATV
ncbi:MAG TPA: Rid family detoxifying hydrolase [Candidatus Gracilibacteria bacterium]|nr:Rid family detoxifying hydrolase [Candidatus Gracilibacteria bacterium]HRY91765.1 Rid family detoxifying hydrolase [Candidatus Gracilibacteria bacterium]